MKTRILLGLAVSIIMVGCGNGENPKETTELESAELEDTTMYLTYTESSEYILEPQLESGFSDFPEITTDLESITIDGQLYYIAEGDLLVPENELRYFISQPNTSTESNKIVGEIRDGIVVKTDNPLNIKFAIIESSFPSRRHYDSIVKFFVGATKDWESTCNVKFIYEKSRDAQLNVNDNPDDLTFVVKFQPAYTSLLASAFFPYDMKEKRKVLIFPRFFGSSFSQQGIMRHEIGHILGFRHEHIRSGAPAVCRGEDTEGTINLTDYDPKSVMHYFCGNVGTKTLYITEKDSIGANLHYPKKGFRIPKKK